MSVFALCRRWALGSFSMVNREGLKRNHSIYAFWGGQDSFGWTDSKHESIHNKIRLNWSHVSYHEALSVPSLALHFWQKYDLPGCVCPAIPVYCKCYATQWPWGPRRVKQFLNRYIKLIYRIVNATHSPRFGYSNFIWWRVQVMGSSLFSFLVSCYVLPLRSKCHPQHPVLKHHQSMFFPKCILLYILIFTLLGNGKENILNGVVGSSPRV
jgi:hypothetical protein